MRRLPSAHRHRSHAMILDHMLRRIRDGFASGKPAWSPGASSKEGMPDAGVELIDCFSLALHVLWTYQQAWAEEGFLFSARLPASTQRLLALIGYRPDPGTAARGFQHLHCKEGLSAVIPPGFQVKAKAEGEKASAVFETLQAVQIRSELNELRPFLPPAGDGHGQAEGTTAGAIAAAVSAELTRPEILLPPDQGVLGDGTLVDKLADRLAAARQGSLAQRNAARARQKALQLAETARALQEAGAADLCAETFEALCQELCETQALANAVPQAPGPVALSESQELLAGQLMRVAQRRPDVMAALEQALAKQAGESSAQWSGRLDQIMRFLEALIEGLVQEARDQVVRLRGNRALTRLDRAYGNTPARAIETDMGVAPPGQDWFYLLPAMGDGELGPKTQTDLLRPGDWLVIGEDLQQTGPDGEVTTQRRYRQAIRVVRLHEEIPKGNNEPMTRITFEPTLTRRYQLSRTVLIGNIAEISHGSTMIEEGVRMGAEAPYIPVSQNSLTWLRDPDPAVPEGRVPQISLSVAGQTWSRVDSLIDQPPGRSIFAVDVTPEGDTRLQVGDGREGNAVPADARLALRYRVGAGEDGNRDAGSITDLASAHPCVVSTFNPLPVSGGTAAEDPETASAKAVAGIHALDRAISVPDARCLALSFGGVKRAAVFRDAVRRREHLRVVVSGPRAAAIQDATRAALADFLTSRMPPGTSVSVTNRQVVAIRARLHIRVRRGTDPLVVIRRIRVRLGCEEDADDLPGLLHSDRVDLGNDIRPSDIYGALEGIDNLTFAFVEALYRADSHPKSNDRIIVAPREIPLWAEPSADVEPLAIRWEYEREM
jgi:hypothetical protein